eukprot:scaffold66271_cov30-Phaeocystis_antarctica.AAC.1
MMRQAVQVMLPSYHPYRLVDEMMHQAVQVMRTNAGMLDSEGGGGGGASERQRQSTERGGT